MGYLGAFPIAVAGGGTGNSTLTSHSVLVGNGTSAITALTVGATGQLMRGSTGANPSFGTSVGGGFSFSTSNAGANVQLSVINSDNTSGSSRAVLLIQVGGSSAGDPFVQYSISGTGSVYAEGIDNSDSDSFKISASAALGTSDIFTCTTSGVINFPLTSCFLAYLASTDSNVTGAGATYILGNVTALTEVFDLHGDFNTNGTFTAPVTGRYDLRSFIYITGTTIATSFVIQLVTSNRTYQSTFSRAALASDQTSMISTIADMDSADTATVKIIVSGEASDTDDVSGSSQLVTYFCGALCA